MSPGDALWTLMMVGIMVVSAIISIVCFLKGWIRMAIVFAIIFALAAFGVCVPGLLSRLE